MQGGYQLSSNLPAFPFLYLISISPSETSHKYIIFYVGPWMKLINTVMKKLACGNCCQYCTVNLVATARGP